MQLSDRQPITAPHYNEVSKIFYKSVYEALNGTKDVKSALAESIKADF